MTSEETEIQSSVVERRFFNSNEEDDISVVVPRRTASSLHQKWSKFVMPLVTKFISLTHRYPIQSGEGEFYCACVILIIE